MAFCCNCGSELRERAKFCSKCGTPVNSSAMTDVKKTKRKQVYVVLTIFILLVIGGSWYLGKDSQGDSISHEESLYEGEVHSIVEPENESDISNVNQALQSEEQNNLENQREKEFQDKMIEYAGKIQNIMTQINSVYNRFASASSSLDDTRRQMVGVNAMGDISDLSTEGDMIFRKMMNLAREYGRQDMVGTIKQEMDNFDRQAYTMSSNINQYIYN